MLLLRLLRREVELGFDWMTDSRWDIRCIGLGLKRDGNEDSTSSAMGSASGEDIMGDEELRRPRFMEEEETRVRGIGGRGPSLLWVLVREV